MRAIVEEAAAADRRRRTAGSATSTRRSWTSSGVEALGAAPLHRCSTRSRRRRTRPRSPRCSAAGSARGAASLFGSYVDTDAKDPSRYLVHLSQSGLGLPDESYYREDAYAEIRAAYVAHLARLAELVGLDRPAGGWPSR